LNASWRGIDAKRVVDLAQGRFGDAGLADMQRAAVTLAEGGGDALLHRQGLTQTGPGCHPGVRGKVSLPTCLIEFAPDRLHHLIGQHGDEQVPLGAREATSTSAKVVSGVTDVLVVARSDGAAMRRAARR
jgi:hypothetical protein